MNSSFESAQNKKKKFPIQKSIPGPVMLNKSKIKNLKPRANARMIKTMTKTRMKPTRVSDEPSEKLKN